MTTPETASTPHFETLADFLRRLWRAKLWLLAGMLAGLALGFGLLQTLQPHYEAHMIVAPALTEDMGESFARFETGNQMPGQVSSATPTTPSEFVWFEQILREQSVAAILSRYDGLPAQIGQERLFTFQDERNLSGEALGAYLRKHVQIEPVGASSSRKITYSHPDPAIAVRVLKHLHMIADTTLRQKAGADTQSHIAWLQKELAQTSNPEHRAALTTLLLTQERRRMLVAMDGAYAAELVEPPSASPRPVWPSKGLVLIVAVFIGMAAGLTLFSLRGEAHP